MLLKSCAAGAARRELTPPVFPASSRRHVMLTFVLATCLNSLYPLPPAISPPAFSDSQGSATENVIPLYSGRKIIKITSQTFVRMAASSRFFRAEHLQTNYNYCSWVFHCLPLMGSGEVLSTLPAVVHSLRFYTQSLPKSWEALSGFK